MGKGRKIVCFLVLILVLSALRCGGTVYLHTTPTNAEVFVLDPSSQKYKKAGVTPVKVSSIEPDSLEASIVQLKLVVPGSLPTYVAMPTDISNSMLVNFKLKRNSPIYHQLQEVTASLFSFYFHILKGQNALAEKKVRAFIQNYPFLAVGHLYLGELLLLKEDVKGALFHYRRAMHLNPKNKEVADLLKTIESLQ